MLWIKKQTVLFCLLVSFLSFGARAEEAPVVFLKDVRGDVVLRSLGDTDWRSARAGTALEQTTEILSGKDGRVVIWLEKDQKAGQAAMSGEGVFRFSFIHREQDHRKTVIELGRGTLMVQGDRRSRTAELEVHTPTGRVAVRDAAMRIRVD